MKKPIFFSIFLALTFSANQTLNAQHDGYYMPSKQPASHATAPNIDSIAMSVLINALTVWDEPEFYEPNGFIKRGNQSICSMIAIDTGTLVQVDKFNDSTATVSLIYAHWGGYWEYSKDQQEGWYETNNDHQNPNIPQINERINPMLWGLYTARLQSELKWFQGPEFQGVIDSLEKIAEYMKERKETVRIQEIQIQSIWGIWDSDFETPSIEWYEGEKAKVDADAAKNKLYEFGVLVASDTTLAGMYGGRIEHPVIMGDTATVIFWPERPGIQIASLPYKKLSSDGWQLQVRLDNGMFFMNNDGEVTVINEIGDQVTEELIIQKTMIIASTMIPF